MKTITNKFKIALAAVGLFAIGTANAQQTTGNITRNTEVLPGAGTTGSIRVIDNKGTIKYLNSSNGITMLTNDANGKTTTTWQLGGELTSATTIDINGQSFTLDGAQFNLLNTAAINTGAGATADDAAATTAGGDGYMLLVRDEDSGQVKKLLLSDLIQQGRGQASADGTDEGANSKTIALPFAPTQDNVMVYRNGAKLIAGTDYTVTGTNLTIAPDTATGTQGWEIYDGDFFEYHFSK